MADRIGILVGWEQSFPEAFITRANKVPGIRAALCYDRASARNSREHNHANVLTLGGRMLTESQAEDVLRTWLATPFGGGRHQGRIDKITEIERRYSQWNPQKSKD